MYRCIDLVYNTLSRWTRRVINMLRTNRDILLIVLVAIIAALVAILTNVIQNIGKTNWGLPIWYLGSILGSYFVLIVLLVVLIIVIIKRVLSFDKKQETEDINTKAKIDAIIDGLHITSEEIRQKEEIIIAKSTKSSKSKEK